MMNKGHTPPLVYALLSATTIHLPAGLIEPLEKRFKVMINQQRAEQKHQVGN